MQDGHTGKGTRAGGGRMSNEGQVNWIRPRRGGCVTVAVAAWLLIGESPSTADPNLQRNPETEETVTDPRPTPSTGPTFPNPPAPEPSPPVPPTTPVPAPQPNPPPQPSRPQP